MAASMRDLNLTRRIITSTPTFQIPVSFFPITINNSQRQHRMATKNDQSQESTASLNVDNKTQEKEKLERKLPTPPPPPPPPEKPEPGDCCGSGCVRCVWDVYYEELEEYDKLYKDSNSSDSKPPS
ncbi:uncharacterized protein LOC126676554 [Mercurialis annua]|uniref:uncharacterized protein LOC126676554 n=1 Tax=Mercurialis annua TaxID=3986 RepID=UPI0021602D29|nr:uncharacterized protein LOC126676554 [Mercurialis annua]